MNLDNPLFYLMYLPFFIIIVFYFVFGLRVPFESRSSLVIFQVAQLMTILADMSYIQSEIANYFQLDYVVLRAVSSVGELFVLNSLLKVIPTKEEIIFKH